MKVWVQITGFVAMFSLPVIISHGADYIWNNASGGDLTQAANWLVDGDPPADPPGPSDNIAFNLGSVLGYTVNLDSLGPTDTFAAGVVVQVQNDRVFMDLGEDRTFDLGGGSSTLSIGTAAANAYLDVQSGTISTRRFEIGISGGTGYAVLRRGVEITGINARYWIAETGTSSTGTLILDGAHISASSGLSVGKRGLGVFQVLNGGYSSSNNFEMGAITNPAGSSFTRVAGNWWNPVTEEFEYSEAIATGLMNMGGRGPGDFWVEDTGRVSVGTTITLGTGNDGTRIGRIYVQGTGSQMIAGGALFAGGTTTEARGTGQVLVGDDGIFRAASGLFYSSAANRLQLNQGTAEFGTVDAEVFTPGTLEIQEDASLEGRGTVNGHVLMAGNLRVGELSVSDGAWTDSDPLQDRVTTITFQETTTAQLDFGHNLTFADTAQVHFRFNSAADFDKLTVGGDFTIEGGTLHLHFAFAPDPETLFNVVAFQGLGSGSFDDIIFSGELTEGFVDFYLDELMVGASPIPEPAWAALILLGPLAWFARHRRTL